MSNTGSDFSNAFKTAQNYVAKALRVQDFYWVFLRNSEFRQACSVVHDFADDIIFLSASRTHQQTPPTFLDSLARRYPDRSLLRSNIINTPIAGRDTVACTVEWTFYLLLRHPAALQKLRQEILEASCSHPARTDLISMVARSSASSYPPSHTNSDQALVQIFHRNTSPSSL